MKKSVNIAFDLDGNIADLYGKERWLEKIQGEEPNLFDDLPFMPSLDTETFKYQNRLLQQKGANLMVITWLPLGVSAEAEEMYRQEKLKWIENNMPYISKNNIYILPYGVDKHTCFKHAKLNILLDDDTENCRKWNYYSTDYIEYKAFLTNDDILAKMNIILNELV